MSTETGASSNTPRRGSWLRRGLVALLLIGLGGAGGFALGLHKAHAMFWYGMERVKRDPDRVAAHIERRVNWVLSRVDASAEQKSKVSAIAKSAVTDLAALGIAPWETRTKFINLLRADTVDPLAVEALRTEQNAKWDAATKRIAQAVIDAASVLTPEQRRQLTERWVGPGSR